MESPMTNLKKLHTDLLDTHNHLMNARCGLLEYRATLQGILDQIKELESNRYEYPHTYSWFGIKGRSLKDRAQYRLRELTKRKFQLEELIELHHFEVLRTEAKVTRLQTYLNMSDADDEKQEKAAVRPTAWVKFDRTRAA